MPMRLITGADSVHDIDAVLRYRADDPFAVHLDFRAFDPGATWIVSRELLLAGLHGPAGAGDVRVEPCCGTDLFVALGRSADTALLHTPLGHLARFLAATTDLVPVGSEGARIDWDGCITALLSS
ncbi:SsgA family sporulation/cell division regulator [Kitasatospora sp. NPDC085879]|uniref:SsgA family sporulation/cell division regulator n=1 Tax=Kitasatospora sp. NPDC085879 TaxID=3154769 RepID=UPI00342FFEC5